MLLVVALFCSACATVVTERDPEYGAITSVVSTYTKGHYSNVEKVFFGKIKKTSGRATACYTIWQSGTQIAAWPLKSTLAKSNEVWVVTATKDNWPFLTRIFGIK